MVFSGHEQHFRSSFSISPFHSLFHAYLFLLVTILHEVHTGSERLYHIEDREGLFVTVRTGNLSS